MRPNTSSVAATHPSSHALFPLFFVAAAAGTSPPSICIDEEEKVVVAILELD